MCRWPPTPRSPGLCRARQCPQLVLLDVHLGQLYGPDVYAQLCERWGRQPPVILLTAEGDSTLRRQAAERGWGFLAKPVRPPALRALMSQTFCADEKAAAPEKQSRFQRRRFQRIALSL